MPDNDKIFEKLLHHLFKRALDNNLLIHSSFELAWGGVWDVILIIYKLPTTELEGFKHLFHLKRVFLINKIKRNPIIETWNYKAELSNYEWKLHEFHSLSFKNLVAMQQERKSSKKNSHIKNISFPKSIKFLQSINFRVLNILWSRRSFFEDLGESLCHFYEISSPKSLSTKYFSCSFR